ERARAGARGRPGRGSARGHDGGLAQARAQALRRGAGRVARKARPPGTGHGLVAQEMRVPYSRPAQLGTELGYLREALEANELSSGGRFSRRCEEWLTRRTGAAAAHVTQSATAALEMAALLADLGPGDEVVMPAFAYVSCA